jgi:hypothetical protein
MGGVEGIDVDGLNTIIRSPIALKAVRHAVEKVEEFNRQPFPYNIIRLGIGGSSLRSENPKDVDLVVEAHGIGSRIGEWEEFRKGLSLKLIHLNNLLMYYRPEGRRTMEGYIKELGGELEDLGFKDTWIENWFPWVRISEITWKGMPPSPFDEKLLITRFIKDGWKGKRLEIHARCFGPDGKEWGTHDDVPDITVWRNDEGLVNPEDKEVELFLQREQKELWELAIAIIRAIKGEDHTRDFPMLYHSTIMTFFRDDPDLDDYPRTREIMKKLAAAEIKELSKIADNIGDPMTANTKIRGHLKRFAFLGQAYVKMVNIQDYEWKEMQIGDFKKELSKTLTKRLRPNGYLKKDIDDLIDLLNIDQLLADMEAK